MDYLGQIPFAHTIDHYAWLNHLSLPASSTCGTYLVLRAEIHIILDRIISVVNGEFIYRKNFLIRKKLKSRPLQCLTERPKQTMLLSKV